MTLSDCQDNANSYSSVWLNTTHPQHLPPNQLLLSCSRNHQIVFQCLFTIFVKVSTFNNLPCLISHYGAQHIEIYHNNYLNLELCCLLQPCRKYIVLILIMSDIVLIILDTLLPHLTVTSAGNKTQNLICSILYIIILTGQWTILSKIIFLSPH